MNSKITELDVLKAIGYQEPEQILILNLPVLKQGQKHNVFGHLYYTKVCGGDMQLAKSGDPLYYLEYSYLQLFINKDLPPGLKFQSLEEAINNYPEYFNPKGEKSIFKTYKGFMIMPAYDKRVAIVMEPPKGLGSCILNL